MRQATQFNFEVIPAAAGRRATACLVGYVPHSQGNPKLTTITTGIVQPIK